MVCPVARRNASSVAAGSAAEPLVREPQPARRRRPARALLGRGGVERLHQLGVDRRHRHEHARAGQRVPDVGRVERQEAHLGARPQRAQQRDDQAVRVMQRQHVQQAIVAPPAPGLLQRRHRRGQRRVRQAHAFRPPRRPRRVEHQRVRPRPARMHGVPAGGARLGEQLFRDDDGTPGAAGQPGRERAARDDHRRRRVGDHVRQLGRRVQRRQRHRQRARVPDPEQRLDERRPGSSRKATAPPGTPAAPPAPPPRRAPAAPRSP